MADHRNPKATKTGDKKIGAVKWIGIALAVLVALLLLGWLLGWYGGDDADVGVVGEENPSFGAGPDADE